MSILINYQINNNHYRKGNITDVILMKDYANMSTGFLNSGILKSLSYNLYIYRNVELVVY